ncbi:hypothetical protein ID866_12068 [Astraeus odoratus]|nr:hypothetical protein ID866_12068 [Astraeus odoratus]
MSAFCHTPSPNNMATAKVNDPQQHMEEDWTLILEAELNPMLSDDEDKEWREAEERRACEEVAKKAWEEAKEACKAQEEVEKKEREEREAAAWKAWEAVEVQADKEWRAREAAEAQADAEQRSVKERLWNVVVQCSEMVAAPPWVAKPGRRMSVVGPSTSGQRASGVQDPCTQCCNKGTCCILGMAKGKTMACEACCHTKVSCSWTKKTTGEVQKKKWVCCSEEADDVEMVEASEDNEEEDAWLHFTVLPHLAEEHRDTLRALTTTLDTLSMEFYKFWRDYWGFSMEVLKAMDTITQELKRANDLKEEEMGRSKGKGKEKEEGPRRERMEDEDGDMEMGRVGPSSLA